MRPCHRRWRSSWGRTGWSRSSCSQRLGIPTARFGSLADSGLPALVKSRRLGYDGKGQRRVALDEELGEHELAEEIVPFDRELSIIAVRGRDGETRFWPLAENVHRDGILRSSRSPAVAAPQAEAEELVGRLLEELDYVGVLALELFEVDGRLLANEFAPRVHNTGHWTIDGAVTSQFENHLRAILGLPLGSTDAVAPAVMLNLIGGAPPSEKLLELPGRAPAPLRQGTAARAEDRPRHADRRLRGDGRRGDCARGRGGRRLVVQPWRSQVRPSIVRPHDGQRRRRRFVSSIRFVLPLATIVQPTAATATTEVSCGSSAISPLSAGVARTQTSR